MVLKISQLEQYTDQQQHTINDVVGKVNDEASIRNKSDQSIPGVIDTSGTPSASDSLELSTEQALITSLTSSLVEAERNQHIPHNKRGPAEAVIEPVLLEEVEEEIKENVVY